MAKSRASRAMQSWWIPCCVLLGVAGCAGGDGGGAAGGSAAGTGTGATPGAGGAASGGANDGGATSETGGTGGHTMAGGSAAGGSSAGCGERVVLAQSQTTSSCGFDMPPGSEGSPLSVAVSIGGQDQIVCRRFSSQGCTPGGWWSNGGEILLCDETCSSFNDFPGRQLVALVGCSVDC